MNVHVTVDLDGDILVAVKTATGADAVDRLRHESARLADARHPGVVTLVSCRDLEPATAPSAGAPAPTCQLRTAYAGEPLTRWTGSVADIGGVAAAVAATLADLHDLGIVHGRLDASHVLLGDGGRPRLCGWAGPDGARAPDDVAAWGRLVDDLLSRVASPRRGLRSPTRGGGAGARRALSILAERATDPVPTRRPPAAALADMVMTAVPAAALPEAGAPPGDRPASADPAAPATRPRGDTLDRIWSYAGEPSEDERWAAAFGHAPPDIEVAAPAADDLPYVAVDTLDWAAPPFGHVPDRARDDRDLDHDGDDWDNHVGHDGDPSAFDDTTPIPDASHRAPDDDDRTRDHVPVGLPRGAATASDHAPRRWRGLALVGGLAGVVVLGAAGLVGATGARGSGGDADATRPAAGDAGCPTATPPAADVDGDGCRETLVVDGSTVDAGVARWTLGEPGDLVAVGDWDCDGEASAALLRPRPATSSCSPPGPTSTSP